MVGHATFPLPLGLFRTLPVRRLDTGLWMNYLCPPCPRYTVPCSTALPIFPRRAVCSGCRRSRVLNIPPDGALTFPPDLFMRSSITVGPGPAVYPPPPLTQLCIIVRFVMDRALQPVVPPPHPHYGTSTLPVAPFHWFYPVEHYPTPHCHDVVHIPPGLTHPITIL